MSLLIWFISLIISSLIELKNFPRFYRSYFEKFLTSRNTSSSHYSCSNSNKIYFKNLHQEKLFPFSVVHFLYVFPFELLLIKWNTKELKFYFVISRQSQADRKPTNYEPCPFTLDGALGSVKQTVPRLHFSETTMNNHRKSGKPNPEQK